MIETNRYFASFFLSPLYEGIAESDGYLDELLELDIESIDDLKYIINKFLKPYFDQLLEIAYNNLKYSLLYCINNLGEPELEEVFLASYAMINIPPYITYCDFFKQILIELYGEDILTLKCELKDINSNLGHLYIILN